MLVFMIWWIHYFATEVLEQPVHKTGLCYVKESFTWSNSTANHKIQPVLSYAPEVISKKKINS